MTSVEIQGNITICINFYVQKEFIKHKILISNLHVRYILNADQTQQLYSIRFPKAIIGETFVFICHQLVSGSHGATESVNVSCILAYIYA